MSGGSLVFDLPLPPSKNELHGTNADIRIQQERAALLRTWVSACGHAAPTSEPPNTVRAWAHFRTGNTWDEGNLSTALYSIVFDALSKPPGQPPNWRRGLHERKGFLVDDSPRHLELVSVTQAIEPNRKRRGLTLTLEATTAEAAATRDGRAGARSGAQDAAAEPETRPGRIAGGNDGPAELAERVCEAPGCEETFQPTRKWQKYHDDACRKEAYRARRQEKTIERVVEDVRERITEDLDRRIREAVEEALSA